MLIPRLLLIGVCIAGTVGCGTTRAADPVVPTTTTTPGATTIGSPARVAGWTLISVGAAAGTVAIGTSAIIIEQANVRDRECSQPGLSGCTSAGLSANASVRSLVGWNAGAWALAGIGLGVGAFLILTNPVERSTTVSLGPDGASLRGTF